MRINRVAQRVREDSLRIQVLVLQCHLQRSHQVLELLLVLVDSCEIEVLHLHHGLDVLRCRVCSDILTGITQRSVGIALLASQCLGELIAREVTDTAHANHLIEDLQVRIVCRAKQRLTTPCRSLHLDFVVLEVGLLQNNSSTIRERQLLITKDLVLSLLDNLTGLNLGDVDQWLVLDIVYVGLNLLSTGSSNGSSHVLLGRINLTLLFLSPLHNNEVAVSSRNQFRKQLVDSSNGDIGGNLLHHLIEHIQWGNRLVRKIVITILVTKLSISALVAVGILLLQRTQVVCLGTSILRSGEAELTSTSCLTVECLQRLHVLAFLGHTNQFEAVLGLRQQILAIVSICLEEGAALLLCHLVQALAHHARDHIRQIALDKIAKISFLLFREGIVLHHNHQLTHLHFLILIEDIDSLAVVGNGLSNYLGSIGVNLDTTKEFLNLSLHVININITNYDDGLIVWTIPLVIVGLKSSGFEAIDDRHQTDRHAQTILRTRIHLGQ